MNLLKTFESRISDAFGAAPDGYTAPFSFKKLAKRAARIGAASAAVSHLVNGAAD